jgi:hypothetical protein
MSLKKMLRGDYVDLNNLWQDSYHGRRLIGTFKMFGIFLIVLFSMVLVDVIFNLGITTQSEVYKKSPSFVDGSGYISINASPSSNVFELKEVTSEFSVGNIITIGDSKKEHEITEVNELKKSESGNSQLIFLMDGVGFETNTGMKVSVVR